MVKRIKEPSTPSNYGNYDVDHHTNLSQQTEERWLPSVIINSPLVFNPKSLWILTEVRSRVIAVFCSCASLKRNWCSPRDFGEYMSGVIRCSSSIRPMRCCVREFIRSPQAMRLRRCRHVTQRPYLSNNRRQVRSSDLSTHALSLGESG
jgi:hypothetical protein